MSVAAIWLKCGVSCGGGINPHMAPAERRLVRILLKVRTKS
jgi:hypothetical protein